MEVRRLVHSGIDLDGRGEVVLLGRQWAFESSWERWKFIGSIVRHGDCSGGGRGSGFHSLPGLL